MHNCPTCGRRLALIKLPGFYVCTRKKCLMYSELFIYDYAAKTIKHIDDTSTVKIGSIADKKLRTDVLNSIVQDSNRIIHESEFSLYQVESHKTAVYPNVGNNINYVALGLCDEAGEVAGKVKKLMRDDNGILTEERKAAIVKELGDVLWYVAEMATTLDVSLNDIAFGNIGKLKTRQEKGTLKGDGDDR